MTLPEFHEATKAFARFHGGAKDEPTDDEFWAWVGDGSPKPSLQ